MLALEDLHWSDPTSLRLTGEFARLAATGPLLVLATRRPEPDPGVGELEAELAADPDRRFRALQLGPSRSQPSGPWPARCSAARLATRCSTPSATVWTATHCSWRSGWHRCSTRAPSTGTAPAGGSGAAAAARVPEALERLVRSRADRLSPASREAMVAASVLGEDLERSALGAVSELGAELDDALAELVSAGLLTEVQGQPEPLYRFRHAIIREATYNGLLRSQRRQLHARAAWDLEARATDRLEEVAAVLGGHFAAAGEADRAVHYLEMAGDHAARVFANEEAIASYRQALAVMDETPTSSSPGQPAVAAGRTTTAVDLCEKLALLLLLVDRFSEARTVALAGLARVRPEDALRAARLQYALSNIEFQDHNFDAALAACAAIDELIRPCGVNDDRERVDLWVHMQTNIEFSVHFWRNELERAAAVIESVRPLVETVCSPQVVACFNIALAQQHVRERRYRVDAQVLEDHRRSVAVARALGPATTTEPNESQRCFALSNLGMVLTWHGDLAEAQEVHEQALASAVRQGRPGARGRVLVDLAVNALRRGDVEVVRELAAQAREARTAGGHPILRGGGDGAAGLGGLAGPAGRTGACAGRPGARVMGVAARVLPLPFPGSAATSGRPPRHWAGRRGGRGGTSVAGAVAGTVARRAGRGCAVSLRGLGPCRTRTGGPAARGGGATRSRLGVRLTYPRGPGERMPRQRRQRRLGSCEIDWRNPPLHPLNDSNRENQGPVLRVIQAIPGVNPDLPALNRPGSCSCLVATWRKVLGCFIGVRGTTLCRTRSREGPQTPRRACRPQVSGGRPDFDAIHNVCD